MMRKSLNANYSAPFQVGEYENYMSKFSSRAVSLCLCILRVFLNMTYDITRTTTKLAKIRNGHIETITRISMN